MKDGEDSEIMNKRVLISSVLILLFALYVNLNSFQEVIPLKKPLDDFPLTWKGWSGSDHFFDEIILDKLRVSEYIMREYRKGDDKVSIYIGYYGSQKKGVQIHSPKHCLPAGGWFMISEASRSLNIEGVGDLNLVQAIYQKGETKEVFYYWYQMKNQYITNEYVLKLYMIINSLRYRRNDAAFIRLSSTVSGDMEDTIQSIDDFMIAFLPLLKDYLPE